MDTGCKSFHLSSGGEDTQIHTRAAKHKMMDTRSLKGACMCPHTGGAQAGGERVAGQHARAPQGRAHRARRRAQEAAPDPGAGGLIALFILPAPATVHGLPHRP